jgi:hypothetical protein
MFVKYQPLKPTNEVVTDVIEPCDAEHGPLYELVLYHDKAKVKYSLEHKDSMEVQIVELTQEGEGCEEDLWEKNLVAFIRNAMFINNDYV